MDVWRTAVYIRKRISGLWNRVKVGGNRKTKNGKETKETEKGSGESSAKSIYTESPHGGPAESKGSPPTVREYY
jgi:hypothetical protein